jgi:hypothetical protein
MEGCPSCWQTLQLLFFLVLQVLLLLLQLP